MLRSVPNPRRFWPFVVGGLLCVATYFQAKGVSSLFGAELVEGPLPSASPAKIVLPPAGPAHADSAPAILKRNPFDSVTGPLVGKPIEEAAPVGRTTMADPLRVPECKGVDVEATTESDDPLWSLAVVQAEGDAHGKVRRIGDTVGDKRIAYIGYNPAQRSPAVWLEGNDGVCQSLLFDDDPRAQPAPKPAKPAPKKPPPRGAAGPPPVPADIKKRIQRVSDTEYNVDRNAVDIVMQRSTELLRSTRVRPVQRDGRVVGIQLLRVRPDTLLGSLGIKNGDVIKTINGFQMSGPEKALQAYARMRTASEIHVQVERSGNPVTIDLHIR
jgi:general secretion pathway protein C